MSDEPQRSVPEDRTVEAPDEDGQTDEDLAPAAGPAEPAPADGQTAEASEAPAAPAEQPEPEDGVASGPSADAAGVEPPSAPIPAPAEPDTQEAAGGDPPPPRQPGRPLLDRRRLLIAGAGAALAAVAGGIAVGTGGDEPDVAGPRPAGPVTAVRSRQPESTRVTPPPVAVQRAPIFTLAQYRKATGAAPFPADAIALTIDDGPHPVWTPKILKLLDRYHVPAMFCMIGNQVLGHEDVAKMVTAAGHQLANHTWSHPGVLSKRSGTTIHREILRAQEKIHDTTGYAPKLFRSPGGVWSPKVLRQVAMAGLFPLDWTNDPRDWSRPGVGRIEHAMLAARPGQILLCHDGGGDRSQTYHALKTVLPRLKARGLRFVAL
ncbi:hypothetical protein Asp14428_18850 [Actinoplanes sp. NBRC 14428]|nr:hypothetical protein Asp14428_18850 [Actinoplanes sp. NBRC 14428]